MSTARTLRQIAPLAAALALLAACGGKGSSTPYDPYVGTPPTGTAIGATEGTPMATAGWRWVPIDGMVCTDADGNTSPTGIGISSATTASPNLVVFLQGGGACWDYVSCASGAAVTGPFGATEFDALLADTAAYPNPILSRTALPAAIADATLVYVPYCTGDVHAGDNAMTYRSPVSPPPNGLPASIHWEHRGHANIMAMLKRLKPTVPSPLKLVVAGSSAGGFGALANYPAFRWYWPDGAGYLIDDSGPPLGPANQPGGVVPVASQAAWYANWRLDLSLGAFCPECVTDLRAGMSELSKRYRNDRIALLSYTRDATIRSFFGTVSLFTNPPLTPVPAATYQAALYGLAGQMDAYPDANARYFFEDGSLDQPPFPSSYIAAPSAEFPDGRAENHTMLGAISAHLTRAAGATDSVTLSQWLSDEVANSQGWQSVKP